ncbi:MAG: glycerate kinase [Candidatus Methanomethylicia archaeon]
MMIINREELVSGNRSYERNIVLDLLEEGVRASDSYKNVKRILKIEEGNIVVNGDFKVPLGDIERIIVVGAGKASARMALGIEEILEDKIEYDGIIIAPKNIKTKLKRIKILEGDHPTPSLRNVENTMEIIKLLKSRGDKDLVIVLISGGGSSLLTIPEEGLKIEDIIEITNLLLKCGANIYEINAVRKHICGVKGGKLFARYIYPSKAITLIISDVIGDNIEVIASGPTALNTTTPKQAKEVLKKYGLWDTAPNRIKKYLDDLIVKGGWRFNEEIFNKVKNIVIANNLQSLIAMKEIALKIGYNTIIISSKIQGEAREAGKIIGGILLEALTSGHPVKSPAVIIAGGETTVTVKGSGKGGRNQELALSTAKIIDGNSRIVFASMGSDGIDGNTDVAGAIVDDETMSVARGMGLNEDEYLNNNDTYNFFRKIGNSLIITGVTETNVNDFMIGVIRERNH